MTTPKKGRKNDISFNLLLIRQKSGVNEIFENLQRTFTQPLVLIY